MRQKRAYRYRCYPTTTQAAVLARTFGCARFVYNWALRLRTDAYTQRQERLGYQDDLGGAHAAETAAGDGVAQRGVQCAHATGVAPPGDGVSQLLCGSCQVSRIPQEAWHTGGRLCHLGLSLGR